MNGRGWAITVWILFLISSFSVGISGILAIVIAYLKLSDLVGTDFESHMTSLIRTFWIEVGGLVLGIIFVAIGFGFPITLAIGYLILFATGVWGLFRTIRGLVRAIDGRPIVDPTGWW